MSAQIQGVKLRQHLARSLRPGYMAEQLNHVTEFTIERTASRELDGDMEVIAEVDQVEARHGAAGHVGLELLRIEDAALRTRTPGVEERVHHAFGLSDYLEIGLGVHVWTGRGV